MTTRKEINDFIENLTTVNDHRKTVASFCFRFPTWNPIKETWDKIEENEQPVIY